MARRPSRGSHSCRRNHADPKRTQPPGLPSRTVYTNHCGAAKARCGGRGAPRAHGPAAPGPRRPRRPRSPRECTGCWVTPRRSSGSRRCYTRPCWPSPAERCGPTRPSWPCRRSSTRSWPARRCGSATLWRSRCREGMQRSVALSRVLLKFGRTFANFS